MKKYILVLFILGFFIVPAFSFASFDVSLKYGSRGDAVIELQDFLQDQGFLQGQVDGRFGLGTRKAVIAFQIANGLQGDGYFGLKSRVKADSILALLLKDSTDAEQAETGTIVITPTEPSRPIISTEECTGGAKYSSVTGKPCTSIIMPTTPSITVLTPNGGEVYKPGQQVRVSWKTDPDKEGNNIWISLHGVTEYVDLVTKHTANDGDEYVTIPSNVKSGTYKMTVAMFGVITNTDTGAIESDSHPFTITSSITPPTANGLGCSPGQTYSSKNGQLCTSLGCYGEKYSRTSGQMCYSDTTSTNPVISGVSGPQTLGVNQTGTWTVKAYSSNSGNLSYSVDWGEPYATNPMYSSTTTKPVQQSATFTHSYSQAGTYTPTFTVTSENTIRCNIAPCPSNEGSAKTSLSVNVENSNAVSVSLVKNTGYPDSQIGINTVNAKIGSFILNNQSTQDVRITSFRVQFSYDFVSDIFRNLKIYKDGTQFGSTLAFVGNNNYVVIPGLALSADSKSIIDVYADSSSSPATLATKLQATYYNSFSNAGPYTTEIATGQNITIQSVSTNAQPVLNPIAVLGNINAGQSVNFNFSASDADNDDLSWNISWGDGAVEASTCLISNSKQKQRWTKNVSHAWNTAGTYTVEVNVSDCRGGTAYTSLNVNVGGSQILYPTVSIFASPNSIASGGSSIITWSSTNATYCIAKDGANGWEGNKNTSGSFNTGVLSSTSTTNFVFNITCYNSNGAMDASATVTMTALTANALSAWNSATLKPGCTPGAKYSRTTGQSCN